MTARTTLMGGGLALLAACSTEPAPTAEVVPKSESFTLAWQANVNGDIEPCG